ncbi:MAG: acetyl-CoA carboxylase biotin carboxyl carrier protein [Puniceicoccales bacterium]|nr:acetyl-CoA carboxylase biotin carboxyl carrier protein [Puniceicoccales bacterium]
MRRNIRQGNVLDLHEIEQLANLLKSAGLQELEIERKNMRVKIVNRQESPHVKCEAPASPHQLHTIIREDKMSHIINLEDDSNYCVVRAPIVGTFYSAPSPESPDFVSKNTPVDVNSVVCVIEAMKVMNEIQAEVKGIVADVLVQDGQAVEFGQPLFKIKKS